MPYDPQQMMQLGQYGFNMMAPQQSGQQKEWWQQPLPPRKRLGPGGQQNDQTGQSASSPANAPMSLLQMLGAQGYGSIPALGTMNAGGMSPWLSSLTKPGGPYDGILNNPRLFV